MSYQTRLIEYLKENAPRHALLVDEVAEVLSISKDSAYRRIRGSTPMSIDEAMLLCDHFNADLSYFFTDKYQTIPFRFNRLFSGDGGLIEYLNQLKEVVNAGIDKDARVMVAAEDVPVFHHFEYPQLAGFKLFYWQKAVMNEAVLVGQPFHVDLVHPDVLQAASELSASYNEIHSTEIWTEESINSTLRQILYFLESGQFQSKKSALAVMGEMQLMTENLQRKAEKSSKNLSDDKNFVLYNSEVRIGNNCTYIEAGGKRTVYISHNTFNSISTMDPSFCDETLVWMQNLIRKSTSINDVSEKHRYQFFKTMFNKISEVRARIENA